MPVRIEKIEMQGFKSFARKTQLLLPSNFSIVCGPNGSGKSNVLDAVCFVLGRKSAKSLRADRMMEMIFSGSDNLKAADFAKVSLFFDNRDKIFPIDDEKVSVTRKVNKKGVSIYQLNGKTVTREKMLEVLRKANIHPDGHNIILQGDVTEIVEMSDYERREIIDEVAGIAEFDEKREKAKREIEKVETRLKEAAIILTEREKSLEKLKDEADSARRYEKMASELDILRASLAKKKLVDAEKAMGILGEKIEKKEVDTKKMKELLNEIDKEFDTKQKSIEMLGESLIDRTKDMALIKEIEELRSDIFSKRNKVEVHESSISRLNDIISRLKEIKADTSKNKAVKAVLAQHKRGVYGTISQLSKVDEKYQTAISVCAGGHIDDIITDTKDNAIGCVNYLKQQRLGRAVFLPLDRIKERNSEPLRKFLGKKGVIGLAMDLVEFDSKYWHAFSFVFGGTVVVDTIETAKEWIGRARFVTLDGDLVERSGAIIGGFYRKNSSAFSTKADVTKYKKEKEGLQAEIAFLQKEANDLQKKLTGLMTKEETGETKVKEMTKERKALDEEIKILRERRRNTYDLLAAEQSGLNKLKINRARLEAELDNAKSEFDTVKKDVKTYKMNVDVLQERIRKMMIEIQRLGAINQKAVHEYDELKKLHAELKEKVDTLAKERDKIFEMITEIESRRKEVFLETLNEVSKHFAKVFNDLTGGQGTLRLEGEDLDEARLLIQATPPGRKVLNIDSMSGGQKTMTALAFLFAIQQYKPAPFYVLDEVDAALDKPNSQKVAELIIKYRGNAQFIVITHNDETIRSADCVYGVSMEKGLSKLVGIRMP
jgi:chromosome segregation protein